MPYSLHLKIGIIIPFIIRIDSFRKHCHASIYFHNSSGYNKFTLTAIQSQTPLMIVNYKSINVSLINMCIALRLPIQMLVGLWDIC